MKDILKMKNIFLGFVLLFAVGCNGKNAGTADENPTKIAKTAYSDERIIFDLNAPERAHFVEQMHNFFNATEGIIAGLSENDMKAVAEAAYTVTPKGHKMPAPELKDAIHSKMQPEFKIMLESVRMGFQSIYEMGVAKKTAQDIQAELSKTLQVCSACHAAYQVPTK